MNKKKIELDGKTWIQNSISIWSDIRKSNGENILNHPAIFPMMLPAKLINCFSFKDDTILDPFAGTGSTIIAAKRLSRNGIGIELSKDFIELFRTRVDLNSLFDEKKYEAKMINDDALNMFKYIKKNSIQLTITSPPYWDVLNQKRTADNKKIISYGNSIKDLGNIISYKEFLKALKKVFSLVFEATKKNGFCCVILMDLRKKSKYYPFHLDTTLFMEEIGFTLDDIIIWDRRQEYNNLRPLGFPYVFRVNKVHEYILIFKK